MGLLRSTRTGRTVARGARALVGRSGACALLIESRLVSNEHAALWWEAGGWHVRDAGSRNGTRLDGRTLAAGERAALPVNSTLTFGHEEHTWVMADAGPPVALAQADDGTVVEARGGCPRDHDLRGRRWALGRRGPRRDHDGPRRQPRGGGGPRLDPPPAPRGDRHLVPSERCAGDHHGRPPLSGEPGRSVSTGQVRLGVERVQVEGLASRA